MPGATQATTNGAPTRSELRRDVVRTQIQEQAAALFSERGFSATTLQDIARAVGMTRPALYHYLESKDALLADIAHDLIASINDDLGSIAGNADLPPPQRLNLLVRRIVIERLSRPHRYLLFVRSGRDLPDELNAAYVEAQALVVRTIEDVLVAGLGSGDFRDLDTSSSAHTLFGMASWVVWWAAGGTPEQHHVIAEDVAGMAVASVRSIEPPPSSAAEDATRETITDLRRILDRLTTDLRRRERS